MEENIKKEVELLLKEWYQAKRSLVYEWSGEIDADTEKLNVKRQEWEKRLGLKTE